MFSRKHSKQTIDTIEKKATKRFKVSDAYRSTSRWSRGRKIAGISAILLAAALLFGAPGCTQSLFYFPVKESIQKQVTAATGGEWVTFQSEDGTQLTGVWMPAASPAPPKGTVVHLHGNAGNLSDFVRFSSWMTDAGYNVFLIDYRGFGESHGKPSHKGVFRDAVAAIEYAYKRPENAGKKVIVFGQSIGAATTLSVIGYRNDLPVCGAIVDSPFTSHYDIGVNMLSRKSISRWCARPLAWLLISGYREPISAAPKIRCPVFIMHGVQDRVIPYRQGKQIYTACRAETILWEPENTGHMLTTIMYPKRSRRDILAFMDACLTGKYFDPTTVDNSPDIHFKPAKETR